MNLNKIRSERRALMLTAAAATLGGVASMASFSAQAQTAYPNKPVRLVVPFPAGTSPDVIARLWAERFAKSTGQTVVVDNKPGAGTIIAAQAVATSAADGYTLFWTVNNTFSINPSLYKTLPYKAEDFVPISRILSVPFVLLVSAESPYKTLNDLVSAAKAKPGLLTYASAGIGTSPHVVMARLLSAAGISMNHIPYKDYFVPDIIGGRIDAGFDASTTAVAQIKGGRVRALGISSASRVEALKELAPIGETLPGFVGESWHGIFAPRGTPEDVINAVVSHSQRIVDSTDFRDTLNGYGLVPVGGTPDTFRRFLAEDARGWSKVLEDHKIKAE